MKQTGKTLARRSTFAAHLCLTLVLSVLPWANAISTAVAQNANGYAIAALPFRYDEAIRQSRDLITTFCQEQNVPGVSVAVAVEGEIVWSEGFGYADLENRVPVWPSTKFRIGSISKPLTAAAVAQLYEQGRLDLDAPVQRYVPSYPENGYIITTRQLAGHLAGIRHYRGAEFLSTKHYNSVLEGLTIFQNDSLLFPPGTKYSYSSYGWNLISAVVEGASGQDFLSYMRDNVFQPLGMRNTVADHVDSLIWHRTRFYTHDGNGRILNAPFVDNSYKWAGGGFLSTSEDLVRFGSAHLGGEFLKPETVELLFTSQRTNSGEETGYGIGWQVREDKQGRRFVGHSGGSVGGTSILLLRPDTKIVVAVLANISPKPTLRLREKALQIAQWFENLNGP
jgi:CubicO group peptidase (beta-lactamase class C family)